MNNRTIRRRILMIAPTPFFADRGCHVRILGEAKALIALGNQLTLCTYSLGRDIDGITTERTWPVPWYKKLSAGPSYHKFYIDLLLLWKVLRVCGRFRPDIIHAHLHEGIAVGKIASKLFKIPLVADLQGSLTGELLDHKFIPRARRFISLMQWVEKRINKLPSHLILSSTQAVQFCMDEFQFSSYQLSTIMDGIDVEMFSPQEPDPALRVSLGIRPDDRVVVFIGLLTEYQGIDLLLEAIPMVVRECPRAKFLIIGYPNEESYRKKARALGVDSWTCFTGKIPYEETPRYLSLAHVATSPKISTTESNLKLFSYMAMKLPAVVFDNPVNREILGDLGLYAKIGDPKALAETFIGILQDREKADRLGNQSRQKVLDDYSWTAVGNRLTKIYDLYLDARQPA
jgi:glycosyltransferase involved in cell wall biosynthesis